MRAFVYLSHASIRIDHDRDVYAKWSVRAKLMMLEGATSLVTVRGFLGVSRQQRFRYCPYDTKRARRREKYVRRAVPGPFTRALRREMRQLVEDISTWKFYKPLTVRQRMAAAWRAWNVRYEQ